MAPSKPSLVYHGSCKGITGALTPRPQHGDINGDFPEGVRNVVFATDDKDFAAVYTLKTPQMLTVGEVEGTRFSVLSDYEGWKRHLASSQSAVYALPSDSFTNTLSKKDGTPTKEWQSAVAVSPVQTIRHTPETVMQTGTQLFFLDPKMDKALWSYEPSKGSSESLMNRVEAKRKAGIFPDNFTMLHLAKELIDAGLMFHLNGQAGIGEVPLAKSPNAHLIAEDIIWLKKQVEPSLIPYSNDWSRRPRNQPNYTAQNSKSVG